MIRLERDDARIFRWICSVRPEYRISAEEVRIMLKLNNMRKCSQDRKYNGLVIGKE